MYRAKSSMRGTLPANRTILCRTASGLVEWGLRGWAATSARTTEQKRFGLPRLKRKASSVVHMIRQQLAEARSHTRWHTGRAFSSSNAMVRYLIPPRLSRSGQGESA